MQLLTFRTVNSQNLHARAKFRRDRLNGCGNIANFRFPIWRPSAILNFKKKANFKLPYCLRPQCAYSCKISLRFVERLQRCSEFSISNIAAVRHLEFRKCVNFNFWHFLQPESACSCKISKFGMTDYVRDMTTHAYFGGDRLSGGYWANTPLVPLYFVLFY